MTLSYSRWICTINHLFHMNYLTICQEEGDYKIIYPLISLQNDSGFATCTVSSAQIFKNVLKIFSMPHREQSWIISPHFDVQSMWFRRVIRNHIGALRSHTITLPTGKGTKNPVRWLIHTSMVDVSLKVRTFLSHIVVNPSWEPIIYVIKGNVKQRTLK